MMFFVIDTNQNPPTALFPSISEEITLRELNRSKKFVNRTIHSIQLGLKQTPSVHHPLKASRFEVVYKEPSKPDEVVFSDKSFDKCVEWAEKDAVDNFTYTPDGTGDGKAAFFLTAWNKPECKYHWTVRPSEYAYCQESLNNG